jgi:HK97 family phage prohead protease
MPYFITDKSPDCAGWATVKEDGEVMGCHTTKQSAIDQMVAMSLAEKIVPGGELKDAVRTLLYELIVGDYVSWDEFGNTLYGEITAISTFGEVAMPIGGSMVATQESPVATIQVYELHNGALQDTQQFVMKRLAPLTKLAELPQSEPMVDETMVEEMTRAAGDPIAILVDIDDTLIHMGEPMQDIIYALNAMDGRKIIITARPVAQREETVKQLADAGMNYTALFMKDTDQATPAWKASVAKRLLERYDIVLAVDNDEANRRAFEALGIKSVHPSELGSNMEQKIQATNYAIRDAGDWDLLNERQQEQAENQSELVLEYGMFDQSTGANGAHYAPAEKNPFKAEGLICDNCIFYNENAQQCQIVEGMIEPEAVCKLWVIPESKIGMPEENPETVDQMNARWKSVTLNLRNNERHTMETTVERRVNNVEFDVRGAEASADGMSFTGYAAVFNSPSEPLPFTEVIKEGAFKRSLRSRNEIKLFMNHNTDVVLGSTRAGTLRLTEDSRGLLATADLPDTSAGRDLSVLMKRGDVSSMSFGFSVPPKGDKWSEDGNTRELHQVRLHEVSIVTGFPAYEATTASVRSLDILATRTAVDVDALSDAITRLEAGETLDAGHANLISEVVSKLRADQPSENHLLEIKRKQLDLMMKAF